MLLMPLEVIIFFFSNTTSSTHSLPRHTFSDTVWPLSPKWLRRKKIFACKYPRSPLWVTRWHRDTAATSPSHSDPWWLSLLNTSNNISGQVTQKLWEGSQEWHNTEIHTALRIFYHETLSAWPKKWEAAELSCHTLLPAHTQAIKCYQLQSHHLTLTYTTHHPQHFPDSF